MIKSWVGLDGLINELENWLKIPEYTKEALNDEANLILGESLQEVPVDKGNLRASGYVDPDKEKEAVYIGYSADYALPVHERLEVKHVNGKAKFLTDPLEKTSKGMGERIAKSVSEKLKQ